VEKMSVSFDLALGEAIRTSAAEQRQSVSAWLAEAARDRLRLEALGTAVSAWEKEFGALTDEEVAGAEGLLARDEPPSKRGRRRRGAA
jgi:hypothetical protein